MGLLFLGALGLCLGVEIGSAITGASEQGVSPFVAISTLIAFVSLDPLRPVQVLRDAESCSTCSYWRPPRLFYSRAPKCMNCGIEVGTPKEPS
jgi:hypothetical protein